MMERARIGLKRMQTHVLRETEPMDYADRRKLLRHITNGDKKLTSAIVYRTKLLNARNLDNGELRTHLHATGSPKHSGCKPVGTGLYAYTSYLCTPGKRGIPLPNADASVFTSQFFAALVSHVGSVSEITIPADAAADESSSVWLLDDLDIPTEDIPKTIIPATVTVTCGGTLVPLHLRPGYLGAVEYIYNVQSSSSKFYLVFDAEHVPRITRMCIPSAPCQMGIIHGTHFVTVDVLVKLHVPFKIIEQTPNDVLVMTANCVYQAWYPGPAVSIRKPIPYEHYEDSARQIIRCKCGILRTEYTSSLERHVYANEWKCMQQEYIMRVEDYNIATNQDSHAILASPRTAEDTMFVNNRTPATPQHAPEHSRGLQSPPRLVRQKRNGRIVKRRHLRNTPAHGATPCIQQGADDVRDVAPHIQEGVYDVQGEDQLSQDNRRTAENDMVDEEEVNRFAGSASCTLNNEEIQPDNTQPQMKNTRSLHYFNGVKQDCEGRILGYTNEEFLQKLKTIAEKRKKSRESVSQANRTQPTASGQHVDKTLKKLTRNHSAETKNPPSTWSKLMDRRLDLAPDEFFKQFLDTWFCKRLLYKTLIRITPKEVVDKYVKNHDYYTFILLYLDPNDPITEFQLFNSLQTTIEMSTEPTLYESFAAGIRKAFAEITDDVRAPYKDIVTIYDP